MTGLSSAAMAAASATLFAALLVGRPGAAGALPLKRVRFYEAGVAYFERSGAIAGGATTLPVPAAHLDDALKTLVVLSDAKGARVDGVEFESRVSRSLGRALAGLSEDGPPLSLHALMKSLKGARVRVSLGGERVDGRIVELVDAEDSDLEECVPVVAAQAEKDEGCRLRREPTLILMTDEGTFRRLRARDVDGVRPMDPALAKRLDAAVDAGSPGSVRAQKDLELKLRGAPDVKLGYVAEAPVWRTTYRLVIDTDGKQAALQGWALLHNDTDEPWRAVAIELVSGRPDSFLFPLVSPRYLPRELEEPESVLTTVPQLLTTTPDAIWAERTGEWVGDAFGAGGLGLSGVGQGGGGTGAGIGLGSIGTVGAGAVTGAQSSKLTVGNLAGVDGADGVEAGALFRYALDAPLDLDAHASALVPFVGDGIAARPVAFFAAADRGARSAAYLAHGGTQTLPAGTIAVFAQGGFSGETRLRRMKPGQTQVIQFGDDLDVDLRRIRSTVSDQPRLLAFDGDDLVEHFVRHHVVEYRLENRGGSATDVVLELAYVDNAKVRGADELLYEAVAERALARFAIGPKGRVTRKLDVHEGLSRRWPIVKLGSAELERLAVARTLPVEQRHVIEDAAVHASLAARSRATRATLRAELDDRLKEATRLREHARALGKMDGVERIVERLLAAEARVETLRGRIGRLDREIAGRVRRTLTALGKLAE